jgi:hypothetical protein
LLSFNPGVHTTIHHVKNSGTSQKKLQAKIDDEYQDALVDA